MENVDQFLKHYGVIGMKWGRRKATERAVKRFDNEDYILKKGQKTYRTSDNAERKKLKGKERAYMTVDAKDTLMYISGLAQVNNDFLIKYDVKTNMIGPSDRKRVKTFIDMYDKDMAKELAEYTVKTNRVKDEGYLRKYSKEEQLKIMTKVYTKMTAKQLSNQGYQMFVSSLDKSPKNMERFITSLKKQGYKMTIDDNDIFLGLAKSPIIVFDRNKNLKWVSSDKLSKEFKNKAKETALKNWDEHIGLSNKEKPFIKYDPKKRAWVDRYGKVVK